MKNLSHFVISLLIISIPLFIITSCGGAKEKETQVVKDTQTEEAVTAQNKQISPKPSDISNGQHIYEQKCLPCHQPMGEGIKGQFPPLAGSDYLLADKKRAVNQVLNGSSEGITVNGEKYTIPMPPQVNNHQDAVDVINYVLNSFGNNGGTITLDEVKDIKIVKQ